MSNNSIPSGRQILIAPGPSAMGLQAFVDSSTHVMDALPDVGDEPAWGKLRTRTIFILDEPGASDLARRARSSGCGRVAIIEGVSSNDLVSQALHWEVVSSSARPLISAQAPADLSIVEYPAAPCMPLDPGIFGSLGTLISDAAIYAGTHPDYATMASLALISGVTSGSVTASPRAGWVEPCIVFATLLGAPGTGKTGALRAFEPALRAVENDLRSRHDADLALFELQADEKAKKGKDAGPVRQLLRISDFTPEAAAFALSRNGRGLLGYVPELASILPQLGVEGGYSSSGSLSGFLLSAYDGGRRDYTRRSAGDEPLVINNLALPLIMGAQPDLFALVLESPRRDGLSDRFMVAYPAPSDSVRTPTKTFDIVEADLCKAFRNLRSAVEKLEKADPLTRDSRVVVPFTPGASAAFDAFAAILKARAKYSSGETGGARIKAVGQVLRVAGLAAYVRHVVDGAPLQVDEQLLGEARDFIRAALDHRGNAEAMAFEPLRIRKARALARAVVLREAFIVDPVEVRRNWGLPGLKTEHDLREALLELSDLGWVEGRVPRNPRDPLPREVQFCARTVRSAKKLLG